MIEVRHIGTYRTRDGALVHCVPRADGELRFEAEDGRLTEISLSEGDLVKLSDDPCWPDRWGRDRVSWPSD